MLDRRYLGALALMLLSACVSPPSPESRRQHAVDLAQHQHWQSIEIDSPPFRLQAFAPTAFAKSKQLTLYLEGDGLAWITSRQPSNDPTPIDPLGLRLALAQPTGNAAYLARPCQYSGAGQGDCTDRYWTDARFAETVVASLDKAISELKARANAQELVLVGYSGGAAIALLVAARRDDVRGVITVAGNLDTDAWTQFHHVQPLRNSLNPGDQRAALASTRQWHLAGERDSIVPPELANRFVSGYPGANAASVWVLPGYDHHCCWAEGWPDLWRKLQADAGQ